MADELLPYLQIAAGSGNQALLRVALGADRTAVHRHGPQGVSVLHLAAEQGHLQCVRDLLEAGADIDAVTSDGPRKTQTYSPASVS